MTPKYNFILLLFFACITTHAQEYSITEIDSIAYTFFNEGPQYAPGIDGNHTAKQISSIEAISRDSTDYMYIVNAEDSAGWVIVSNEKTYPTIIAHGKSGNLIYDNELLPPALLCILDTHMDAIDSTRNEKSTLSTTYASSSPTVVYTKQNLIDEDYWKQSCNNDTGIVDTDKMYNKYCDQNILCIGGCHREYVGCGPVAMAKIMRYWQWPNSLTVKGFLGINDTTYYYDWNNMPRKIENTTDMYQVDAVAHLFRSCGLAAKTWSVHFGSATLIETIHNSMISDFGFHSNLVQAKKEGVDVTSMLKNEIDAGRPVLVQAYDKVIVDGHSFVVDGYEIYSDQQIKFHVHFGQGNDNKANNNYCDLTFNGYPNGQVYLIELYPECSFRANDVSLSNPLTITANANRTYYSTNNVTLCSNNNSITVENGGHLLVKAGNEVRLKSGFHAKAGSEVHIAVTDVPCNLTEDATASKLAAKSFNQSDNIWCNQWNILSHGQESNPNDPFPHARTSIYWLSENTVNRNGYEYIPLMCSSSKPNVESTQLVGELRFTEEDKQVYFYYDNTEYLLYDFGAQVGDQLQIFSGINNYNYYDYYETYTHVVTRREYLDDGRIKLTSIPFFGDPVPDDINENNYSSVTWIEGVGSEHGIVHNNINNLPGMGTEWLLCAYRDDECRYTTDNPEYMPLGCIYNEGDVINAVESVSISAPSVQKIIKDGQLLILRDGQTYNVMGMEVK